MTTGANHAEPARCSAVAHMFDGRSVFITGASGFIGRVLLEKLLRCYAGIKHIYILLRKKKNESPVERLNKKLLNAPIFDQIRNIQIDGKYLIEKIIVVPGDISKPQLGMSDADVQMLIEDPTLSIVFHSAATIKFDELVKVSVQLNLIATKTLLEFCRSLPGLISFCHVSTAYVNSHISTNEIIEERLYPINEKPNQVIRLAENMDEKLMQKIKSELVADRPNTYTYTKALTEHLIISEFSDLPIAIVRPSIVGASWQEPLPGWVDNLNGPTGIFLAVGKGLLRSLHLVHSCKADVVPADIVVNTLVAASYYAAIKNNKISVNHNLKFDPSVPKVEQVAANGFSRELNQSKEVEIEKTCLEGSSIVDNNQMVEDSENITIFHCASGDSNSISWGKINETILSINRNYPSEHIVRYPAITCTGNKHYELLVSLFAHYLPALIIDMLCIILGKKSQLLATYHKVHRAAEAIFHFTTHNYDFGVKNLNLLKNCLNQTDQKELYMDISEVEWSSYYEKYMLGIRRYILKESDESLDEARCQLRRVQWVELIVKASICFILIICLWPFVRQTKAFKFILGTKEISQPTGVH